MRLYRDIPLGLEQLYKDGDYIKRTHGHDLSISIENNVNGFLGVSGGGLNKKRKRHVGLVKDSFSPDEDKMFAKL